MIAANPVQRLNSPILQSGKANKRLACDRQSAKLPEIVCALLLFGLLNCGGAFAAPTFSASLDRNTIYFGEHAQLSLSFTAERPQTLQMDRPMPDNITSSQPQTFQRREDINGQSTLMFVYSYVLQPKATGQFTIPAITARFAATNLTSAPMTLRVLDSQKLLQAADNGGRQAFLNLVLPDQSVFVGEVFPVEIQLYVQHAQNLRMPQLEAEGFTLGKPIQQGQSTSQIGNSIYNVVTFRIAATPAKAGHLTLGPAECSLDLRGPSRTPAGRSVFDPFADIFAEWQPVTLRSDPVGIEVVPLPAERQPADFTGAVGRFAMSVEASPTNVTAGDPITLRIEISGRGGLEAAALPEHKDWQNFKIYPAKTEVEAQDPLGVSGVKKFEQVIVPELPTVTAIPEVHFSYFDPETKTYETLRRPAIPLQVRPAANLPQPKLLVENARVAEPPPPQDELVHIKALFGTAQQVRPALLQQAWFLTLQTVPFLAWVSALIWRRRIDRIENDPRLKRRLRARREVERLLSKLQELAQQNRTEEFFAIAFRLLQEQLGERVDLPPSAITEAVLEEKLPATGVPMEFIAKFQALFELCNQARYAPERSAQELLSLIPQFDGAVRQLQQLPLPVER